LPFSTDAVIEHLTGRLAVGIYPLKDRFETITITGDDSESARQSKLEQIKAGHYKIVLSTGQLVRRLQFVRRVFQEGWL